MMESTEPGSKIGFDLFNLIPIELHPQVWDNLPGITGGSYLPG